MTEFKPHEWILIGRVRCIQMVLCIHGVMARRAYSASAPNKANRFPRPFRLCKVKV